MTVTVRDASAQDASAIAAIHVASWSHFYRGLLSDQYLDSLTPASREPMWKGILAGGNLPIHVWVAEEQGHVVGFCSVGPSRDQSDQPGVLELYAIYLFPSSTRRGIGSLLIDAVVHFAQEEGVKQLMLWVLRDNGGTRAFYESHDWNTSGITKHDQLWGQEVIEIQYTNSLSNKPEDVK